MMCYAIGLKKIRCSRGRNVVLGETRPIVFLSSFPGSMEERKDIAIVISR